MMNKRHETDCGLLHEDGPEHCTCRLLPCPFCGNVQPGMLRTDAVWCGSCLATMPEHDREVPNAIDRWNTRDACTGFAMSGLSAFEPTEAMWQAAWDASEDYFLSDRATVEGFRIAIRALLTAAYASAPAGHAAVEAAFKEGVATGYQCGKADENTTDEWHSAWLASDASVAAALVRPRAADPTLADMAAFGASDAACTLYPGTDQQAERAAFCEGAAHAVSRPRAAVGEREV